MAPEYTSGLIINGYIKAEFHNKDLKSGLENYIELTDLDTGNTIKFHYTVLKELKRLLKNRELKED